MIAVGLTESERARFAREMVDGRRDDPMQSQVKLIKQLTGSVSLGFACAPVNWGSQ